jgi:O-antigen/teichoic acid export membrane protein
VREALLRLTADSVVYGLGQVLGRAVQLLLVPILTRVLAPGAFGVTELVQGYLQMAAIVLVLGMDGALARFFYQEPDRDARVRMVSTSLGFRLLTTGAAAAALAALATPLAAGLVGGTAYRKYVLLAAGMLPFTLLAMFASDVLRVTFQPRKYLVLNFLQTVLVTGLSVVFVVHLDRGPAGVLYGRLVGDALSAVLGLVLIRHNLVPVFRADVLRRMLSYGAPALPAAIGFGVIASLDRYVLQLTRTIEEVAVYAVALRFFSVMTFAASAFQLAYGPFAYARAGSPEAPRLFARVLAGYAAVGSFGALLVSSFAPEALAVLVPPEYAAAAVPALWLAFAAVALGAYTVTSIGIGLALRTELLGACAFSGAVACAVAHAVLTPRYGPPGAAVATLAGYGVTAVVTYRLAQRVHPVPYRGGLVLGLCALALILALAARPLAGAGAAGVAARIAVLAAFAAVCVWLRVWTERGAVARDRGSAGGPPRDPVA